MRILAKRRDHPEVACALCGRQSPLISEVLKVCADCLRNDIDKAQPHVQQAHVLSRENFELPSTPPRDEDGVECPICFNRCRMREGSIGYCGLRTNQKGKLTHLGGTEEKGIVSWYHDPLPTNCVASWVCPAGSDAGYPDFSYSQGPEFGYTNLAVFYEACTFDCLFCQNWHFRERIGSSRSKTAGELAEAVDERTACICHFGGDPTPQLAHALAASEIALSEKRERILRVCWETNGSMNRSVLKGMADLSMESGGCIKFDLKAYSEGLHRALCGVSNRRTLDNFKWLSALTQQRPDPPLLVASTLLIPGYVDAHEVGAIARFIASLDPHIPYSLLAFYPHFCMPDLPTTSRRHAEECHEAAIEAGLTRVRVGNIHLLSDEY